MKVLYINNYSDQTGWSQAGIDNILSLDAAGVDVVPRCIKLNNVVGQPPERIIELEQKDDWRPDVVIQHVLPHFLDYNGRIGKNIATYTSETSNFRSSVWPSYINTMDEVWVVNEQSKSASLDSGVNIPTHVIPYATDISKFNRSYDPLKLRDDIPDDFIFYTIGEFNRRKNFGALIKAFHLEFLPEERVQLVLKTTPVGIKGKEAVEQLCNEVKYNLRLYPQIEQYKKEIIICDHWHDENIMRLHATSDCFVSPSFGEAWCYPAFDALGMGKAVITSRSTGFLAYMNDQVGWLVDVIEEPVFGLHNGIPNLFTGRENWYSPNINNLRSAMREAFENESLRRSKARAARKRVYDFTYEKVGQIMKEVLSG